jgi:glutamate dehydrogenase/leucine dehydrogenase
LARIATIRYQLANVSIAGARLALDYDPNASDVDQVLGRFLSVFRPLLLSTLSLGPDVNVTPERLDAILHTHNLPGRMTAVQQRQGWPSNRWKEYLRRLEDEVGGAKLRDRQIVYGVAQATMVASRLRSNDTPVVCVIGEMNYAYRIAMELSALGAKVVGLGTTSLGMYSKQGIDPTALIASGLFESIDAAFTYVTASELYAVPVDVLVIASHDCVTLDYAGQVVAPIVIEALPNAVSHSAERVLSARKIAVVPAFAATLGGVLLADCFVRGEVSTAVDALEFIASQIERTIEQLFRLAGTLRISLRDAGVRLAFHRWNTPPPGMTTPDAVPLDFVQSLVSESIE